jgi:signal transduction histidine kinase
MAAGFVIVLPAIALWTFDALAPQQAVPVAELHSEKIVRSFAPEDAVTSRTGAPRKGGDSLVANDVSGTASQVKAPVPALHASNLAMTPPPAAIASTAVQVAPALELAWQKPEVMGSLAVFLSFAGLAVALILSVARDFSTALEGAGERSAERLAGDLRRLAEQVRLDVADTVHDVRSPLGVLIGSIDTLRRAVPREDPRASRAIQLADIAAERLVRTVDGAWHTGDRLAALFLTPRQRVDLGRILLDVPGNRLGPCGLNLQCHATSDCFVSAPEGVLDHAVDSLFQTLRLVLPAGTVLFCSAFVEGATVCLEISVSATAAPEWEIDLLVPKDAARTVSLLGGRVEAFTKGDDIRSLRLVLPRQG